MPIELITKSGDKIQQIILTTGRKNVKQICLLIHEG